MNRGNEGMNNGDNVNNVNSSNNSNLNNSNNGNNKRYNRYHRNHNKKEAVQQKPNIVKSADRQERPVERNDRADKTDRFNERPVVSQRNQFESRHYNDSPRNGYTRKYETIDDIQADIKRIEAEIRLEIKEIKTMVLGL